MKKNLDELRAQRLAEFEAAAWRADIVSAVTLQYDDFGRDYADVAADVGISPDALEDVMDFRDLTPETEAKLRAWAERNDVPPAHVERGGLVAFVLRLPSEAREDALHDLSDRAAMQAERLGVRGDRTGLRQMGNPYRGRRWTLAEIERLVEPFVGGRADA